MLNSEHVNELGSSGAHERAEAIDWLLDQAERLHRGDPDAHQLLLRVGQLLVLAGGSEALTTIQGLAHDASSARERDRNLAGLIGAPWEEIPAWRAL